MELVVVEYFPNPYGLVRNKTKYKFHSYISGDNEQDACYSHNHMVRLLTKLIELGLLVYGMSNVW